MGAGGVTNCGTNATNARSLKKQANLTLKFKDIIKKENLFKKDGMIISGAQ